MLGGHSMAVAQQPQRQFGSVGDAREALGALGEACRGWATDAAYRSSVDELAGRWSAVVDAARAGERLPVDLGANAASLGVRLIRATTIEDLRAARAARAAYETDRKAAARGAAPGAGHLGEPHPRDGFSAKIRTCGS